MTTSHAHGPARNINWDLAAPYYDDFVKADFDLRFIMDRAASAGGPVLELMCGSGRITMPLAETGVAITALDSSAELLARLRGKLSVRGLPVRLVEADARAFDLGERFRFVFIGFHALAEVLGSADRLRVLEHVRAHLEDEGTFLLTLHNPPVRAALAHSEWRRAGRAALESGLSLEVDSRWDVDRDRQRVWGVQRYREVDARGSCAREVLLPIVFDLVSSAEVADLARQSGMEVRRVYGDYDGSALDPLRSPYMLFEMVPASDSSQQAVSPTASGP
jgi:SAM-dependent methyltransferase